MRGNKVPQAVHCFLKLGPGTEQKELPPEVGWLTQGHVMLTVKWDYQGVSADSLIVAYGDLIQNPDPQN